MVKPELRPYQIDVADRVAARVREGARRVILQAATGGGKAVIAAWLMARCAEKGKRAVFLVHRRILIEQMITRLKEWGHSCGVIMNGYAKSEWEPIQLVSRDTLFSRAVKHDWITCPPADLVIVDECHSAGAKYEKFMEVYGKSVLIGTTATPVFSGGRGMGCPAGPYQALECAVPTSQLVKDGFLSPVKCFSPLSAIKARKGADDGKKRKLAGDPVYWWKRYGQGRPTVLFAAKVEHAEAAMRAFLKAEIPAELLYARTPDEERTKMLRRVVSGETKVICSVSCLVEGVDVPELSCGIIFRSAGSTVVYRQLCGRLMRTHPTKPDGAILIDHAGAVQKHGFPDEDVEWTLDPDDTVGARVKKAKEDGKMKQLIVCRSCGHDFSGATSCPNCGLELSKKRPEVPYVQNEILVEAPREQDQTVLRESTLRAWDRFRAIAANRNQKCRAASAMYRARFGRFPEQDDMPGTLRGHEWDRPANLVWAQYVR